MTEQALLNSVKKYIIIKHLHNNSGMSSINLLRNTYRASQLKLCSTQNCSNILILSAQVESK